MSKDKFPEIMLDLILFGNPIFPKDISKRIEVIPTDAFVKGERNPEKDIPKANLWSLCSKGSEDVEEEWAYIKSLIGRKWQEFTEITNMGGKTKITIIARITKSMPSVYMPAEMIKDAAQLGAIIDIEYYNYVADNKE